MSQTTTGAVDEAVDKHSRPILDEVNKLKLALFGTNLAGGVTLSDVENRLQGTWEQTSRLVRHADRLGLDAVIPVARWRSWGGEPGGLGERGFETFTWAAGLAAITEHVQVFATFHVPLAHPVLAAKMCTTIDHISGGRFGLNVVAGWYAAELAMFGVQQRDHDVRYEVADEWMTAIKQLWAQEGEQDFHGAHFDIAGGVLEPKPLQRPYPTIMNAATSPAGRAFAAKHSDVMFAGLRSIETAAEPVAEIKRAAREDHGREVKVFGRAHIVCKDTEKEAREYFDYVHLEKADFQAAANVMGVTKAGSKRDDWSLDERKDLLAVTHGFGFELVGTAEQVAEQLVAAHEAGIDGLAVTFVDYEEGMEHLEHGILPLLAQAGVRAR